ncbi:Parvalbumin [Trema orientale]|uniref:Parvalbumin n=1 Tax=Trema orientale TaxID=63057 RepID=A0A2P5EPI8_TREOI|nr:Parvalbumin [Trema orientale]
MGQVLDKLQGKDWRRRQIRKITDKVFDGVRNQTGKATLTFEDLYIAVLLVYNDINKRLPGPHFDPPSKDEVKALIQLDLESSHVLSNCWISLPVRLSSFPAMDLACAFNFFLRHRTTLRKLSIECDINLDGEIDREEFVRFIQQLTAGAFITVSQGLILTLVVAPTVAVATKKATEGVPGVGKVVQKLPNSIYASIITLAIVLFQKSQLESED